MEFGIRANGGLLASSTLPGTGLRLRTSGVGEFVCKSQAIRSGVNLGSSNECRKDWWSAGIAAQKAGGPWHPNGATYGSVTAGSTTRLTPKATSLFVVSSFPWDQSYPTLQLEHQVFHLCSYMGKKKRAYAYQRRLEE